MVFTLFTRTLPKCGPRQGSIAHFSPGGDPDPDQRGKTEPVQLFLLSQLPRVHRLDSGGDTLYVPVPAAVNLIKEVAVAVGAAAAPLTGLSDLNSLPTDGGQGILLLLSSGADVLSQNHQKPPQCTTALGANVGLKLGSWQRFVPVSLQALILRWFRARYSCSCISVLLKLLRGTAVSHVASAMMSLMCFNPGFCPTLDSILGFFAKINVIRDERIFKKIKGCDVVNWPLFSVTHEFILATRWVCVVVSVQGIWEMEGQQLGSGKERFLGVSFTSDPRVHQEHPRPRPQAHHPDDHWQSDQEVWDPLPVVSNIGR